MNIEFLLQNATTLITTPRDVAKLRQTILTLAVQGKLVSGIGYDNWKTRTISEITTTITPGFACTKERQVPNGYVHLRMNNVSTNGKLDLSNLIRIDPNMIDIRKSKLVIGDVLFNNTNSQALVGKTAIIEHDLDAAWSNHLTLLRFCSDIDSRFIVWYFTFLRNVGYFSSLCTRWINQAAVNSDTLKKELITYPPLAEQRRIVARVDELMAICDTLEAQLQARERMQARVVQAALARVQADPSPASIATLLDPKIGASPADLRQTILALAVQGKLVPQEAVWNKYTLKNLTTKIGSGSTPEGGKNSYVNAGIPLIRSMNVHTRKFIFDGLAYLSHEQANKLNNVTTMQHDVLLNITGASIGRVSVIPDILVGARVNQHVCIIRPKSDIVPKYLEIVLASPQFQSTIFDIQVGATREALTKSMIESFEIPLPPLAEQRRIVARVDELMALVDRLEAQQTQASTLGAQVLDALVGGV